MGQLTVKVKVRRQAGWALPRHRVNMSRAWHGVLVIGEKPIPDLNRHSRVATLLDPATYSPVADLAPLIDVTLVHATSEEWVLAGIERVSDGLRTFDYAQSWEISFMDLRET